MAAPADSSSKTAATTAGQDEAVVMKTTMPLPRAIQLVMAIPSGSKSSTTTTASSKTIEEYGLDRPFFWIQLVVLPSMFIVLAAGHTYAVLCDDDGAGDFGFVPIPILLCVYMAWCTRRGPLRAADALRRVGNSPQGRLRGDGPYLMLDQAWPMFVPWACLLGLLVASTIAFWLCLLRTYGDGGGGGGRRRENISRGEAVIDGLAYLYSRLLYEYAVRFPQIHADEHAGMPLLDADVAVV